MENPLKATVALHHGADCSRAKPRTQTSGVRPNERKIRPYNASAFCGDSPAYVCDVCVLKFSPYVFFSENPWCFSAVDCRSNHEADAISTSFFRLSGDLERNHGHRIQQALGPGWLHPAE